MKRLVEMSGKLSPGRSQKRMIVHALSTLVLTGGPVRCYNWACEYLAHLRAIYRQTQLKKTIGGNMELFSVIRNIETLCILR